MDTITIPGNHTADQSRRSRLTRRKLHTRYRVIAAKRDREQDPIRREVLDRMLSTILMLLLAEAG